MFALAEDGHRSLFEQLVGCILSIRTLDEVSLVAARRLFAAAPDPAAIAGLRTAAIDRLIADTAFHAAKAAQIRDIARDTVRQYGGRLPCDAAVLQRFRGADPSARAEVLGGDQALLVPFGKHVCTGRAPRCSTCPALDLCRQMGLPVHR